MISLRLLTKVFSLLLLSTTVSWGQTQFRFHVPVTAPEASRVEPPPPPSWHFIIQDINLKNSYTTSKYGERTREFSDTSGVPSESGYSVFRYASIWPEDKGAADAILSQIGDVSHIGIAYTWLLKSHESGPSVSSQLHVFRVRFFETVTTDIGPSYGIVTTTEATRFITGLGFSFPLDFAPKAEQQLRSTPVISYIPLTLSQMTLYFSAGARVDDVSDFGLTLGISGIDF